MYYVLVGGLRPFVGFLSYIYSLYIETAEGESVNAVAGTVEGKSFLIGEGEVDSSFEIFSCGGGECG